MLEQFRNSLKERFFLFTLTAFIISLVIAGIYGIVSSAVIKPVYKATISLVVFNSESEQPKNYNDVMMSQQLVKTYSEYAKSRSVAEDVIKSLELKMDVEKILSMVTVAPKANTQFLIISVKSNSPEEAYKVANQFGVSLKKVSTHIMKYDLVKFLDNAHLPTSPVSPNIVYIVEIAFFISFIVLFGVICLIRYSL